MINDSLSSCQIAATKAFMEFMESDEKYFLLYSGPGCGKTYLSEHLVRMVGDRYPKRRVICTATTNKAAAVLSESLGRATMTIHKLLSLIVRNDFKTGKQFLSQNNKAEIIHNSLILMDEGSMADSPLAAMLDKGTRNCKFLIIGDADQLSPVDEPVSPLFYRGYTGYELLTVMRQAKDSGIIPLSAQLRKTVRTGTFYPLEFNGKDIIHADGPTFQRLMDEEFRENHTTIDHAKVICWRNATVNAYNSHIRSLYTDSVPFEVGEFVVTNNPIQGDGETLFSTDQMVEITSAKKGESYDVAGYWYGVDNQIEVFVADNPIAVKNLLASLSVAAKSGMGKWTDFFKCKESFADLRAVHACTSHKSQGSTYGTVFIDLNDIGACFEWQTVARMLYVAVTRAKHKVVFYGKLPPQYTFGVFPYTPPSMTGNTPQVGSNTCDTSYSATKAPTGLLSF